MTGALPFDPRPETEDVYERSRELVKECFADWCSTNAPGLEGDVGESLLHQKWTYLDRELTRWACADLDEVYLHLHPAKVIVGSEDLDSVIDEGRAFVLFMAEAGWLDDASDDPEVMLDHLEAIRPEFARLMADESMFSPGKQIWTQAIAEGVEMDDERAVSEFVARYNERIGTGGPSQRRLSLFDRTPQSPWTTGTPNGRSSSAGRSRPGPDLRLVSGRATPPGTPPKQGRRKGRRR